MTVQEARRMIQNFDESRVLSKSDEFRFIEAMNFLIEKERNPRDMMYLGGYYYEIKQFDLALKYYEMAAALDYDEAYECLGYIWYYGRTGEKDYPKAFSYFSKMMEKGHLVATYKVADMYKNGYGVAKDVEKYKAIIESLYEEVKTCTNVFDPIPEVYTRLAHIRKDQGRTEEAVKLFFYAKMVLAQRIQHNAFFGNLNIMKWLIDDVYQLYEFDEDDFDFYDLYYLLKTPHVIRFTLGSDTMELKSVMEDGACVICFNGKWFRDRDAFFQNADINGVKVTAIADRFYDFEVVM